VSHSASAACVVVRESATPIRAATGKERLGTARFPRRAGTARISAPAIRAWRYRSPRAAGVFEAGLRRGNIMATPAVQACELAATPVV
jgi:hypothetical protein